jgi:hypothetical protein
MRVWIGCMFRLAPLLLLTGIVGCEQTIDPATGNRTTSVTVPGTAAHGERLEERWRQCLQSNPESLCARRLPGRRPPGGSSAGSDTATSSDSSAE